MKIYAPNTKKRATIATIIAKDIDFKTPQEFFFQAPQNSRILITDITTVTNTATGLTSSATVIVDDVGAKPFTAVGRKYTLTTNATQPANDSTVTIGGVIYTFKTTLTASGVTANEVLRGADVAASLTNLTAAITRASGAAGGLYGSGTVTNPYFSATTTATVVTIESKIKTAAVNVIDAAAATYGIPIGASTPNLTFAAAGYGSTATTRENLVASAIQTYTAEDDGNALRSTMLATGEIVPAGYWVRYAINIPAAGTTLNKDVVIAYVILD